MATILKATQQATLAYRAEDKRGNPTTVQNPTWTSSDPTVVSVTASDDGTSAVAAAAGPVGTATITLSGDADLGDGISPITGVADLEVVPGDAALFNLLVGPPTEQADAPLPPIGTTTPTDGGTTTPTDGGVVSGGDAGTPVPAPDGGTTTPDAGGTTTPDAGGTTTPTDGGTTPAPTGPDVSGGAAPADSTVTPDASATGGSTT